MLNWAAYEPYVPPYRGPLAQLPRGQARESFNRWIAARPERWTQLQRLLDGVGIRLGTSDSDIQRVNDWFRTSVESAPENRGRLANRWFAVVNDMTVVLGDTLLERCPGLRWEFYTSGKTNLSYQKHVVMGFANVQNTKYNVDFDRVVSTYGHQVIAGSDVSPAFFTEVLASCQAKA